MEFRARFHTRRFAPALTVLQLKAQLESEETHLVRSHIRGTELADAIAFSSTM